MKKIIFLSTFLTLFLFSCNTESEPELELIRAYCYLYQFVPGLENVNWIIDEIEVPNQQYYASRFPGSVILESASEEITFAVKHAGTGDLLESQSFTLEEKKYYNIIITGAEQDPVLLIQEIESNRPQAGNVKFQMLHAAIFHDSIDVYMGGTTPDKRVVSNMDFTDLSEPFEANDFEARAEITVTLHDAEYDQDDVLLTSTYNEIILSGYSYLSILAPSTIDPLSDLTLWTFDLPVE
jgi:Domain of unknown function (DUF4397)